MCSACSKKRQYAAQDLHTLAAASGMAVTAVATAHRDALFKLETFDDQRHESRISTEWVPLTPGAHTTRGMHLPCGPAAG